MLQGCTAYKSTSSILLSMTGEAGNVEGPEHRAQAGARALGSAESHRAQALHSRGPEYPQQLPSPTQAWPELVSQL